MHSKNVSKYLNISINQMNTIKVIKLKHCDVSWNVNGIFFFVMKNISIYFVLENSYQCYNQCLHKDWTKESLFTFKENVGSL